MNNYKFELYSALGVNRDASSSELKEAYRNLAFKFHPDRNNCKGLERNIINEAMCGINEAYSVLSNISKRKEYDIMLNSGLRFSKPSFYSLVRKANGGAADEVSNNSLEARLGQLLSKSKDIARNVKAPEQAKKVVDEVSSVVRISVNFLKAVYQLYEEENAYKGKSVNRRA